MNVTATQSNVALADTVLGSSTLGATGPSFAAALCGFLSTTVATTMVMFLLSSV
ncbi:hypothetical protein [Methylobacterium sp. J-090]|uniref:hypothetical protein n=1 Tax=Methylobacterium sp. J-090 TaxID=2836666 RepID=UPI001FBB8DA6|nr:hypothetical protein [Methylobacterium sp. J-090]MCJ2083970.1 hypothetical protein [Methylobacterium sp. J-090]